MKKHRTGKLITRALSLILCAFMIFPFVQLDIEANAFNSPSDLDGCRNIFLSYCFNFRVPSSGRRTVEGYKPLVGYYDTDGRFRDTFFDSFLFLPCVCEAPSGGKIYYSRQNPSNMSDWQGLIDDIFLDGYNIKALDTAVGNMKKYNNLDKNYKANVFFSCLYPVETQSDFGDVDGDGISEDCRKYEDRIKIVKWMVDTQYKKYKNENFQNLNLCGFYWFEESIGSSDPKLNREESEMIKEFNRHVHAKGLKTIWIPYNNASGHNRWQYLGFDAVNRQPNYMFNRDYTKDDLIESVKDSNKKGMGVEVEIDHSVFSSPQQYNRYLDYLKICTMQGADKGIKMYYNDGVNGVYYHSYVSYDPYHRAIYDYTYAYAKEKLDINDLVYLPEKPPYSFYDDIAVNKSYKASTPFTNSTAGYQDIDGHELTDGEIATTGFGTDWHAFHDSLKEKSGNYEIVVDLGKSYDNISLFSIHLKDEESASVSLPKFVEYSVSTDNVNFKYIGRVSTMKNRPEGYFAELIPTSPARGRYIKAVIDIGKCHFVMASEFIIGRPKANSFDTDEIICVSQGKNYTATKPYVNTEADYGRISFKELTDGISGDKDILSDSWHAFHDSMTDNGKFQIVIDLGEKKKNLTKAVLEFGNEPGASIGLPDKVEVSASDDNVNFKSVGTAKPQCVDGPIYQAVVDTAPFDGRYVKFSFAPGKQHFIFVSEAYVGKLKNGPQTNELKPVQDADISLDYKNRVCENVKLKTTVDKLKSMFADSVTVTDINGKALDAGAKLYTGCMIVYSKGDLHEEYIVSVNRDVNGDGAFSAADAITAKKAVLKLNELSSAQIKAGDCDGNGKLTSADAIKLKKAVLGLS